MGKNSKRYRGLNRKVPDHLKNFAIATQRTGGKVYFCYPRTENWFWYVNQPEFATLERDPNAKVKIGYELMWLVPVS